MDNNLLEHAVMRTEADGKYTLFLKINPSMLEQDVDIQLNNNKQLLLIFDNGLTLSTSVLSDDIYHNLAHRQTLTIFTDENGVFIANQILEPLVKPKVRLK